MTKLNSHRRLQSFLRLFLAVISICGFSLDVVHQLHADDEVDRAKAKFFEQHVRPLLVKNCFECHAGEKIKGGLKLDSIGHILTGGESGPAVTPEKPDESLLIEAVRYESYEMPPSGKLSDEEIEILVKWVEIGAPWPGGDREAIPPATTEKITEEDRQFWSFRPLSQAAPPQVANEEWVLNDVDRFILAKLTENGLTPTAEAEKTTLIRRLYFDLIGLPPTPSQIDEFLSDSSAEAYERLVDDLLSSPRYGEHWARFWLDLVRYADSDGYKKDDFRPNAWRYRDYVIDAFNTDKPFDQFTREQIAGDEIAPDDPLALAATGFLRCGIYEYNQRDTRTQWRDMLNDITDTVGDTFLGVGMGCARCHDHKFDPILQKDYFRLQAFFANIELEDDVPLAQPDARAHYEEQLHAWKDATADIRARLAELEQPKLKALEHEMVMMFPDEIQELYYRPAAERTSLDNQIAHLVYLQVIDKQTTLATKFKGDDKKQWEAVKAELAKFDHLKPEPLPSGRTISEYGKQAPEVFIPSKERLGEVEPGFLTIFDPQKADIVEIQEAVETSGRRTTLANWLTRENHPLTTRVIVNRIWKEHFGVGIVNSPSDFGHLGEEPSHPELLDWLAGQFVANNWSLKWLHRQIVTSATYRQNSRRSDDHAEQIDPDNRLLWRANIRRLTGEQIRDAQLAVAGTLKTSSGGPPAEISSSERSVYNKVMRNQVDPFLEMFDFPDRITSSPNRNITTSPSQSLLLINGEWSMQRAIELAKRVHESDDRSLESQIRDVYLIALGRVPSEEELSRLVEFVEVTTALEPERKQIHQANTKTQVLDISDAADSSPVQTPDREGLPTDQFTIQATVLLRSLYEDASVRTIASNWDGNNAHAGWSLGVTSTKSAHQPRHLILQFVARNPNGYRTYAVIASGIHLNLNQPYKVSAAVDLTKPGDDGVLFVAQNQATGDVQTKRLKHNYNNAEDAPYPFVIGGRAGQSQHRWDGWIDNVRLLNVQLSEEQITSGGDDLPGNQIVGTWDFDTSDNPLADREQGRTLVVAGSTSGPPVALIDLCHVLLNSNEFLYID